MSENLFHPMYLLWTSIIALIIMLVREGVEGLAQSQAGAGLFQESPNTGFIQYR